MLTQEQYKVVYLPCSESHQKGQSLCALLQPRAQDFEALLVSERPLDLPVHILELVARASDLEASMVLRTQAFQRFLDQTSALVYYRFGGFVEFVQVRRELVLFVGSDDLFFQGAVSTLGQLK